MSEIFLTLKFISKGIMLFIFSLYIILYIFFFSSIVYFLESIFNTFNELISEKVLNLIFTLISQLLFLIKS